MKKNNKPLKFTKLSIADLEQASEDIAYVITEEFIKQNRFLTEDEVNLQMMLAKAMLFRFSKVFGSVSGPPKNKKGHLDL